VPGSAQSRKWLHLQGFHSSDFRSLLFKHLFIVFRRHTDSAWLRMLTTPLNQQKMTMLNGKNSFKSGAYVRIMVPGTKCKTRWQHYQTCSELTSQLLRLHSRDFTSGFDRTVPNRTWMCELRLETIRPQRGNRGFDPRSAYQRPHQQHQYAAESDKDGFAECSYASFSLTPFTQAWCSLDWSPSGQQLPKSSSYGIRRWPHSPPIDPKDVAAVQDIPQL
jgi:hypothetical protein